MRDAKRHLSSLDRLEPPDVWERAASLEPSAEHHRDEIVIASPWKRAAAVVVAFAVFGPAALLAIRAFDGVPTNRDGSLQGLAPGGVRGVWQALPEGPLGPRHGALAFWVDGQVVVIGGTNSQPCPPTSNCGVPETALRDGAAFALSTGTWTTIAPSPVPIAYARGAVLGNTVYLSVPRSDRGQEEPTFLSYDAQGDRWEELPTPPGVASSLSLHLVATDDAIVVYPDSQDAGASPDLLLQPETGEWRELPVDPLVPSFDRSMVWTGSELLLFAIEDVRQPVGSPHLYRAAALNIASGTWGRLPDTSIAGSVPTWFWSAGRAVNPTMGRVGDGDGVMGSGPHYGGLLDPSTGMWTILPHPPEGIREYGGPSVSGSEHAVSWQGAILDVAAGTWLALPAPPDAADDGAAAVWAGDRLLVWGGYAWDGSQSRLLDTGWWWRP